MITLYFMEQERTVTSWELSQMTHVSSRTIKGDIAQINQELKKQGGEIVSKKSEGYFLRVENEEALRRYKEKLELISYYRSPLYEFQDFLRLSVILRKLLLTGETHPAKLEELAESLFVSRSAFRRDMKKCSRFLGSYSLNLHSKPGQDTYVEGQERDVRIAMLAIYGSSLKELGTDYVEEPFFEQFPGEDFHEVRKTIHQVTRREAYMLREEMPDGLPQYLMLMRNRIKDTERFPVFSEKERIFIDNSRQMEVSRRLFEELEKYHGFDMSEDEKRLTAAYLLISHDYRREEIESGRYGNLYAETEELYQKIREFIWQQWGIQGAETAVDGFLYSIVAKIVIRRKLHMLPYGTLLGRGDGESCGAARANCGLPWSWCAGWKSISDADWGSESCLIWPIISVGRFRGYPTIRNVLSWRQLRTG